MSHALSVTVLVYNSSKDAKTCVDQLLTFELPLHVVIVDNCSTDGSFDSLLKSYAGNRRVDVIQADANRGYSAGNNFGMRYAVNHYGVDTVAIMNPDVFIPSGDVLSNLMKLLWTYEDALAVGGQPVNHLAGDSLWPSSWSLPTPWAAVRNHCLLCHSGTPDKAVEVTPNIFAVDCIVGCFFMAKARKFENLGYLDEGVFLYNEENILGKKCKIAGLRLFVDKSQVYYHNHAVNAERKKPLKSRMAIQRIGYKSRRYFVKTFYSPLLVPPLWCAERINELVLVASWLRHRVFRNTRATATPAVSKSKNLDSTGLD